VLYLQEILCFFISVSQTEWKYLPESDISEKWRLLNNVVAKGLRSVMRVIEESRYYYYFNEDVIGQELDTLFLQRPLPKNPGSQYCNEFINGLTVTTGSYKFCNYESMNHDTLWDTSPTVHVP
jgi:hypothetical protein